jgi:uncharacterized protein YciI
MRRQRVIVRFRAGPAWGEGPPEDQPDWDAHAEFVDDLTERGIFVMGGPFSDYSGSMTLLEGVDADEARRLLEPDPFVQNGVFLFEDVREWTVYVDELTPRKR